MRAARAWIDLGPRLAEAACLLVLVGVPVAGYAELYGTDGYRPTLIIAIFAGGGAAWMMSLLVSVVGRPTARREWVLIATVLGAFLPVLFCVTTLAWLVARPERTGAFGPEVAGSLRMLTMNQPVDVANDVMMLPFLATAATTGLGLLALLTRSTLLPLLPVTVALAVQLLLCAGNGGVAQVGLGSGVFALAAVWLIALRRRRMTDLGATGLRGFSRSAGLALSAAALVAGSALAGAGFDRFDPRDRWQPIDTDRQITPLALIRSELNGRDDARFAVLVVGGSRPVGIAVARLDIFDGAAWTARPRFRTAGTVLTTDSAAVKGMKNAARTDIVVSALPGSLLPAVGEPVRLQRHDADAETGSVMFDRSSGMLFARSDPASWAYTVDGINGEARKDPGTMSCRLPGPDPALAVLRRAWLQPNMPTRQTLSALAERMRVELPYSPQAPAGSSEAAIWRVMSASGPANTGFSEQHAAAFSFLVCAAGRPARIVVGYRLPPAEVPGEAVEVSAHDAHAWSEVWFPGTGWVAFDPTNPDKDITPYPGGTAALPQSETGESDRPAGSSAGVTQPSSTAASGNQTDGLTEALRRAERPARILGLSLLLVLIAVWIARRAWASLVRRQERMRRIRILEIRRSSPDECERLLGAWAAVTELFREHGLAVRASSTPDEVAVMARGLVPDPQAALQPLVGLVNAALFGPQTTSRDDADRAWALADELRSTPLGQRVLDSDLVTGGPR